MSNLDIPVSLSKQRSTWRPVRKSINLDLLTLVVLISVCLVIRAHVALGLSAPLWLDESWTLALASVDSLGELIHQAHEEAGGPIYYILIWFWAQIFGVSNASLHFPSLLASLLAPVIAYVGLAKARKLTAIIWAVLIATWIPGVMQSGMARCYPLLLCTSVLSTVVHMRLLARPTQRVALFWSAISTLMILTHYYASFLVVVQALSVVLVHRKRSLHLIPSTVVFIIAVAWIGWSLPRLEMMASPNYAWIKTVSPSQTPIVIAFMLGLQNYSFLPMLAIACLGYALIRQRFVDSKSAVITAASMPYKGYMTYAGVSGLVAAAIVIGLSMWRPILELRYLTPFVPGVFLMGALWMEHISAGHRPTLAIMIVFVLLLSSNEWVGHWHLGARDFNFETASKWISEKPVSKLIFLWDNPTSLTVAQDQMDLVGGVFMRREGIKIRTHAQYPHLGGDMNDTINSASPPDSALIWLYDTGVHATTATEYPPRIGTMRSDLECQDFGRDRIGIYACRVK